MAPKKCTITACVEEISQRSRTHFTHEATGAEPVARRILCETGSKRFP